jgi:outer membrane protein assembly factor BamB
VTPSGADFTTYLANATHTSFIDDDTLVPPLRRLWTVPLGAPIAYPLVVGDRVYATTSATDTTPARVFALDRLTGAQIWSADLGTSATANLAYDNGRLFAVDTQGLAAMEKITTPPVFRAFDAATGALDWQVQGTLTQPYHGGPPIALNGTLYTAAGAGLSGPATLFAYDETNGQVQWTGAFSSGSFAVSADGIFAFDDCGDATALSLDGATEWSPAPDAGSCYPPGTSVVVDHTLYETTSRATNARLDTRTGMSLGTFVGDRSTPAFGDGLEVDVVGNGLQAVSKATGGPAWSFKGEGALATSALIVGGTVFAATQIGTIYAIDATTGKVAWSENTGNGFSLDSVGIAAAHGVLVVPIGSDLIAYGPAGSGFDAGVHDYGGQPTCPWTLVHDSPAPGVDTPTGIAIADFNKDGKLDIALSSRASFGGGGVTVFLGLGNGTFQGLQELSSFGEGTYGLAAADLDGDGVVDVVSASAGESNDGQPNVYVSLGKGDGTLSKPKTYSVGPGPFAMVLADLDGSGRPDMVLADDIDGFRVLLNQGKGTFGNPVAYASGQAVLTVALGDLTGDGKPDVVLGMKDPQTVQVFPGKGNGTFGTPLITAVGGWPSGLALGDVNADGKLDVVVATGDVQILLGKGDGTFSPGATVPAGSSASGVALGDLDLDGRVDLVVTEESVTNSDSVRIFFGNGDGTFQGMQAFATDSFPSMPLIADFNGDGRPDIVTCNDVADTVTLLLGACGARP